MVYKGLFMSKSQSYKIASWGTKLSTEGGFWDLSASTRERHLEKIMSDPLQAADGGYKIADV